MICLDDNIKKVFLTEFIPGHGGDFFITLFSGAGQNFVGSFTKDRIIKRLSEGGNMPGNNVGGKLINYISSEDMVNHINNSICKIKSKDKDYYSRTHIHFATHPNKQQDFNVRDLLKSHTNLPLQKINLIPSTADSVLWCVYHFIKQYDIPNDQYDGIINTILHNVTKTELSDTDINFDHIDILINNKQQLFQIANHISDSNIDKEVFDIILEYYTNTKLKSYLEWMSAIKETSHYDYAHRRVEEYKLTNLIFHV
jgi:hypothetical protein